MKKIVLLIIASLFIFAACGGDEEKKTEDTDSDVVTEDSSNDSEETADNEVADNEVTDDEAEEVVDFPAENNKFSFKINGVEAVILPNVLAKPSMTKAYYIEAADELFINYDSLSTENYAIGFGLYKYKESNMLGDWEYSSSASGSRDGNLTVNFMNRCSDTEPRGGYGMGYYCESGYENESFKVTITEYNGVGGKIAGTFSGTLMNSDCDETVNITDGVFEIRRTEDED